MSGMYEITWGAAKEWTKKRCYTVVPMRRVVIIVDLMVGYWELDREKMLAEVDDFSRARFPRRAVKQNYGGNNKAWICYPRQGNNPTQLRFAVDITEGEWGE